MAARIDGVRSTSQPTSRHRPIKQHLDGIKAAPIRASKPWQTQRSAVAKSSSSISVPTCGDPDPPGRRPRAPIKARNLSHWQPQIQHLKTHQPGVLIRSHRPTIPDLGSHPSRATMAAVQNPPRSEGTCTNQHRLAYAAPEQAVAQIGPFSNLPISAATESPPVVQHACDSSKAASMASSDDDPISNPSTEPATHAKAATPPSIRSPANLEPNQWGSASKQPPDHQQPYCPSNLGRSIDNSWAKQQKFPSRKSAEIQSSMIFKSPASIQGANHPQQQSIT
ncbi:hypothetical protein ACLOJK_037153, partial [Asimina triloba]